MEWFECKYCGCKFEKDGTRRSAGVFGCHVRSCACNPDRERIREAIKCGSKKMNQIVNARSHQARLANEATRQKPEDQMQECRVLELFHARTF